MKTISLLFILLSFIQVQISAQCACCSPNHRQFDFWIGEWNVYNASGQFLGSNSITVIQDSCILQEQWVSAKQQFTGTSYNFYDSNEELWHQTWVDNQGGHLLIEGSWDGDKMVLKSEEVDDGSGNMIINKISWTPQPNGNVRQHWEVSSDQGKTWKTSFDGIYKKKSD